MKVLQITKHGTRSVSSMEIKFRKTGAGKNKRTVMDMKIHFDDGNSAVWEGTEPEEEMQVNIMQMDMKKN